MSFEAIQDHRYFCNRMFLHRMEKELPFGPREKKIRDILLRYFQKSKNAFFEEKEEVQELILTFLTDIRAYGTVRQRIAISLKNFFKSVFGIRPPKSLIREILAAYCLISEASKKIYCAVLEKIFTPQERKILALLNLTSSLSGWENHKLVPVLGLRQDRELSLALWTQLGITITPEQKDLIFHLQK